MKSFFSSNIGTTGRLLRAAWAVAMFVGAWFAYGISIWLSIVLVLFGVLAAFEAVRGWCVMRACGIKTKF